MAALCPGVQYGLSSQQNFGENKDLIFVKLTDSALRAIEEYIKNQNKFGSHHPTIKFLGNENGVHTTWGRSSSLCYYLRELNKMVDPNIWLSAYCSHFYLIMYYRIIFWGGTTMHSVFTPQMKSSKSIEHQSERLVEARVIIPFCTPQLGQHVVQLLNVQYGRHGGPGGSFECVKQVGPPRGSLEGLGSIPNKMRIHANEDVYEVTRTRMTEAEDKYKNKCTREIKPNQTDIGRKVKVKQSKSSILPVRKEILATSLFKQLSSHSSVPSKPSPQPVHSSSNGFSNGLGSNLVSSSRPMLNNKKPSVPDIAKRPLKERLIHLLALKPFRKFELLERLNKEGLRERNGVSSVLKQISKMKDNYYYLNRGMWNEVHEDWPFYSESERQILKRRKPQNLTPPGSSDGGSSGSGQSPTSTHPGSPPPITSTKRPGFQDGPDGFPYKRQRIAHGNKVDQIYRQPIENNSQRRPVTDSRDASNMNPRSRESPTSGYFVPFNGMLNDERNTSDDEDTSRKRSCDSHSLSFDVNHEKTFINNHSSPNNKMMTSESRIETPNERPNVLIGGKINRIRLDEKEKERDREKMNRYNKVSSSSQVIVARVSPDSQTEGLTPVEADAPRKTDEEEYPDFKMQYTTIQGLEQKKQYKTDYMTDYAEYRDLHSIVEKVSKRFALLEERLKQEDVNSPRYKILSKQIVQEYRQNKKDLQHQNAKKRFQYLHDKLSHIKRLVNEYDHGIMENHY